MPADGARCPGRTPCGQVCSEPLPLRPCGLQSLSQDTTASEQKSCLSKECFLYFHNLAESTQN